MQSTDVVIIGGGPSGLFAAFEAGMLGLSSTIIDCLPELGGQCAALYAEKPIYDIPAHPQIAAGDLVAKLIEQIAPFKPQIVLNHRVTKLIGEGGGWKIIMENGSEIKTAVIVIAVGGGAFGPNKPPMVGIEAFENKSIFYFVSSAQKFANKTVVIAGGGDSAVDWAINLADIARKVYVVHRRDKFRAMPNSVAKLHQLAEKGKIEMVIPYQLDSVIGDQETGKLEQILLRDLNNQEKILEADILLPFFGLAMDNHALHDWGLEWSEDNKHLHVNPATMATNLPGVFAIGDICKYPGKLKLILTSFAEGAIACHEAYTIINPDSALHFEYSTTKGIKGHV